MTKIRLAILDVAKSWENITGMEAVNTRQASTVRQAIEGLRSDMMSFRLQYESAERSMAVLIRRLESCEA